MSKVKMFKKLFAMLSVLIAMALTACGGGSGGGSGSGGGGGAGAAGSHAAVSSGTMTKGSVIVNGVRFTVAQGAAIMIDDNPGVEAELQDGMQVHVKGQINDDGQAGVAEKIHAEDALQGKVAAVDTVADPDVIIILAHKVVVDDLTIFANDGGAKIGAITPGVTIAEVHGAPDDLGNIHATRIEIKTGLPENEAELKGTIASIDNVAKIFLIGGQSVNFANAVTEPAGITLVNGNFVEVKGTFNVNIIDAAVIQLEDVEDAEFEPGENEEAEIEGFIAGFTLGSDTFNVGSTPVTVSSATEFREGSDLDLGNGVSVEAEGVMSGGALVAREIKFKRKVVRITTDNLTINLAGKQMTMMGKTVSLNDLSKNSDVTDLTARVEMRGFVDASGKIIAHEIKDAGNSQGNADILQAEVEAKDTGALTITIMGITANLSGSILKNDDNGVMASADAFLAAIRAKTATTGGTLVKVRGTFAAGAIAVTEAEIED